MASDTPFQIALDGPAGSGKSTAARGVARSLGFTYLDSGAMYRAIALLAHRCPGADWSRFAATADLSFRHTPGGQHLFVNGEDVEDAIRRPEISAASSRVSADPRVREALTARMRAMARRENVVMEGRDIGTVVLPEAQLKVFLSAPAEERARRRAEELRERGVEASFEEVLAEMRQRDERDSGRDVAPLRRAPDAVEVDTGGLSADEVIRVIVEMARARMESVYG